MNVRIFSAAAIALCALVASASAGEVAKSTLGAMGLGGMQQLSDNDGLAIRGMGTSASVWGESVANFEGQSSINGYEAAASHRHSSSSAQGKNLSYAGIANIKYSSYGGLRVRATLGVGGGFSSASAH